MLWIIGIIVTIVLIVVIMAMRNKKIEKDLAARARRGDDRAQYDLAKRYQRKDIDEAVSLFKQSANRGHSLAQLELGLLYKEGNDVQRNVVEAARWFQKAAEQGLADAQYNMGCCYARGEGVEKDLNMAVELFKKAAMQNHAEAQYELGYSYMTGRGVSEDDRMAIKWFQSAAENGSKSARGVIGFEEIEKIEDLKNSVGYNVIVKPLQYALVKAGYRLTCGSYKATFSYAGVIYVYDKSSGSREIGSINFAKGPADIGGAEHRLKMDNMGVNSPDINLGKLKYMAVQIGGFSVLLRSEIATATNPPDIPEWLKIGAQVFRQNSKELIDPKWVQRKDYSDYSKYLNVMFRGR